MPRLILAVGNHCSASHKPSGGMICQLCLSKAATCHVTERSPSGRFGEAHYCPECCEAKYLKPPPPACDFPRPRFTLKNVMILVGKWAIPNAIAAWVMRSGYITGTPIQIQRWTLYTFLGVNLVLGFLVVWIALLTWLSRAMWYKRTGGLVPMPEQNLTPRQIILSLVQTVPLIAWCVVAYFLEMWLTPKIWPIQRHSAPLFVLIVFAPTFLILALSLSKDHELRDRVRQEWRTASGPERVLRAVAVAWAIGFVPAIVIASPSLLGWGVVFWFPIPPVMLFGIVVHLVLMAAVSLSIRRR